MKRSLKLLCLLLSALFVLAGCNTSEPPVTSDDSTSSDSTPQGDETTAPVTETVEPFDPAADTRYGAAVNIDCDAINYMVEYFKGDTSDIGQKSVDWFNRLYKDSGASDILYNVDSVVPSESRKEYQDFYLEAQKNGTKLDDTTTKLGNRYNDIYNVQKVDPYAIWIDLCYENNINPWLSFRMNDVHAPNLGYGVDDFVQDAIDKGWTIGLEAGWGTWYQWCLDYSVPEVRDRYAVYIDEMLAKYDVYGIELDWMRDIHCFKKDSKDNCQYMNLFIQQVNEVVEKYEKQYGHDIKIMVRLNRDIDQNMYFGFDMRTWAKNGWFDVVVPATVWGVTDSDMPIDVWKEELKDYDVEVYAGLECIVLDELYQKGQTLAAFTSMYLQMGADKIYLYNLFNSGAGAYEPCSSLEAAYKYTKRSYVVTKQDTVPRVSGMTGYAPLPLRVSKGEVSEPVVIRHGRMNTKWDTYIYIGVTNKVQALAEEANLKVMYNGVECEYKGAAYKPFVGESESYRCILSFKIPKEAWEGSSSGEITFTADSSIRVGYIELMNGLPTIG